MLRIKTKSLDQIKKESGKLFKGSIVNVFSVEYEDGATCVVIPDMVSLFSSVLEVKKVEDMDPSEHTIITYENYEYYHPESGRYISKYWVVKERISIPNIDLSI